MDVDTLDDQPFLVVNGVQTLSRTCACLLSALPELVEAGVSRFRLSPQSWDMVAISRIFRDVLDGVIDAEAGTATLAGIGPDTGLSNGYIYGQEGINYYTGAMAPS